MARSSYAYETLNMWDESTWRDRYSPVAGLARWIESNNEDLVAEKAATVSLGEQPADAFYTSKTRALTYPDTIAQWQAAGLTFATSEMGGVTWIAMLPSAAVAPGGGPHDVLVVLDKADYADPTWAMTALEYWRPHSEIALERGLVALYVVRDLADTSYLGQGSDMYANVLRELLVRFRMDLGSVYLELGTVERRAANLHDIAPSAGSDDAIQRIEGIPVLDVSGRWLSSVAAYFAQGTRSAADGATFEAAGDTYAFDLGWLIHSPTGRRMADAMAIERAHADVADPGLASFCETRGLRFERHLTDGQQWTSLTPLGDGGEADPLPVMLVFQEVSAIDPFEPVSALSCHWEYADLVASGELALLYFAMETPEDNDLFAEIVREAAGIYGLDLGRVYTTGHSHNGHFCIEFMRRHPRLVAAVATLGNSHGLPSPRYGHEAVEQTDEKVELMSTFDMPLININGSFENELVAFDVQDQGYLNGVDAWQRRLTAFNIPMQSCDQVLAARSSDDYATRRVGVPAGRTDVQYRMGSECYIADLANHEGRHRLRLVSIEHMPHMISPQMPGLVWDFVRRFARDLSTGEVIERGEGSSRVAGAFGVKAS